VLAGSWFGLVDLQFLVLGWRLEVIVDLVVIAQVVLGLDGAVEGLVGALHSLSSLTSSHLLDC
jgi:hypothetical protein